MTQAAFGRTYEDGEVIARQGDRADTLYVVQEGLVDVVAQDGESEVVLRSAGPNEILGEMAAFERLPRSATLRAQGRCRILTLDQRNFMRRVNEDPTLAFGVIEVMAQRVRTLTDEVVRLGRSRPPDRDEDPQA